MARHVNADEHARIEALSNALDEFLRAQVEGHVAGGSIAFAACLNVAAHILSNVPDAQGKEQMLSIGVLILASAVPSALVHMGPSQDVFPDGPPSTHEPTKH